MRDSVSQLVLDKPAAYLPPPSFYALTLLLVVLGYGISVLIPSGEFPPLQQQRQQRKEQQDSRSAGGDSSGAAPHVPSKLSTASARCFKHHAHASHVLSCMLLAAHPGPSSRSPTAARPFSTTLQSGSWCR